MNLQHSEILMWLYRMNTALFLQASYLKRLAGVLPTTRGGCLGEATNSYNSVAFVKSTTNMWYDRIKVPVLTYWWNTIFTSFSGGDDFKTEWRMSQVAVVRTPGAKLGTRKPGLQFVIYKWVGWSIHSPHDNDTSGARGINPIDLSLISCLYMILHNC